MIRTLTALCLLATAPVWAEQEKRTNTFVTEVDSKQDQSENIQKFLKSAFLLSCAAVIVYYIFKEPVDVNSTGDRTLDRLLKEAERRAELRDLFNSSQDQQVAAVLKRGDPTELREMILHKL